MGPCSNANYSAGKMASPSSSEGADETEDVETAGDKATSTSSPEENEGGGGDGGGCSGCFWWLSDWPSISLLLFLYTLQGLPLGLIGSVPLIIQDKNATYSEQAKFSLVGWPFSLKLLWAPLVDALYFRRFGRRKSWLIPVQYLIGLTLLFLSFKVDDLLDSLQIGILTIFFFFLNFLTATQDVAVDGWALTMLKRENVGLASTCNAVGQSFGAFLGYAVFLNLASPEFSNKYFRSEPKPVGLVTLSSFMLFWSCIYFVSTTLVLFFKREEEREEEAEQSQGGIISSYFRLWWVLKLPAVRIYILFAFTSSLGFAAMHALSDLKIVEAGLAKEVRALMSIPLTPISLLVPIFVSKWTGGLKPMSLFMKAYTVALIFSGVFAVMVWVTRVVKIENTFPIWYMPTLLLIESIFKICTTVMFVAKMAFVAKISDPEHGATFMTLYNTIGNLGGTWPTAIALGLVDPLTIKRCAEQPQQPSSFTSGLDEALEHKENATTPSTPSTACTTLFDGYYMETIFCILLGFIWFICFGNRVIKRLQREPETSWRLEKLERTSQSVDCFKTETHETHEKEDVEPVPNLDANVLNHPLTPTPPTQTILQTDSKE